ncbi:hypothetical protein MHYP_G00141600 [Metynnis hypsauchen]
MDYRQHRDKTRASYFGNVKNRLGTKMPAGVTQPPGFFTGSWDATSRANGARNILTAAESSTGRHHIRNPKLRQYYLKEAAFPSDANKTLESSGESSRRNEQGVHQGDTVFSVASQFSGRPADATQSTATCSALSTTQQPCVPQSKASSAQGQPPTATNPDLCPSSEPRMDAVTPTTPVSPSTDAEYDKLLLNQNSFN